MIKWLRGVFVKRAPIIARRVRYDVITTDGSKWIERRDEFGRRILVCVEGEVGRTVFDPRLSPGAASEIVSTRGERRREWE